MTTEPAEPIEAVIGSGPCRGQIVCLPLDAIPEVSEEQIQWLNRALDDLIAGIDSNSEAIRRANEALEKRLEQL